MDPVTKKKILRIYNPRQIYGTIMALPSEKAPHPHENIDETVLANRVSVKDEDGYYDPTAYMEWLQKQIDRGNQLIEAELERMTDRWFENKGKLVLACDCHMDTWHAVAVRMHLAGRILMRINEEREREQRERERETG